MDNQQNTNPPPPQDQGQQPPQQPPAAEQPKEQILSDMSETPVAPEHRGGEISHPIEQGSIHTMPQKFIDTHHAAVAVKAVSGKRMLIIVSIVALVLGAITVGAYFYFQSSGNIFSGGIPQPSVPAPDQDTINENTAQPPRNENTSDDANSNVAPPIVENGQGRDEQRVADIIEIARALDEYHDRFSVYPQFLTVIPKDILPVLPADPLSDQPYTYTTEDNRRSFAIVFDVEEQAVFKGEILDTGTWELTPDDFNDDIPVATNTNQAPPPIPPPPSDPIGNANANLDADGDGLTTAEEKVLGTSAATHDSDADGFRDNIELGNFYSPIHPGDVKLDQSGIVKLFTNTTHGYSFYHPAGWVVSVPDADQREVLISTGTGEDFSITVDDNPQQSTSWEWYSETISFSSDTSAVTFVEIAGYEAVSTLDSLRMYVAVGDVVLSIVYNLNDVPTVNYPNIFNLILDRLTIL